MNNIEEIIKYASYVILFISILTTIINFVISKIKIKNTKATNEEELARLKSNVATGEKLIEVIREIIPNAIRLAEKSGIENGSTKKLLAMSQVLLECSSEGFDFETNRNAISEIIEELVQLTNEVNINKKGE